MMIVGVYMNTQLTYMLKDLFEIKEDDVGMKASLLTIYSIPFGMISTFFVSYIFELLGRKWTLFFSYILTAIFYNLLPWTKSISVYITNTYGFNCSGFTLLAVVRCLVAVTFSAPLCHPLIGDYIKTKSRGKAIALTGLGVTVGEVVAMGVLFNYTRNMEYTDAFFIVSCVIVGFAFYFLVFVRDPDMNKI